MIKVIVCSGRYPDPDNGNRATKCEKVCTEECPLKQGMEKLDRFLKFPCYLGIIIPAVYITLAKGEKEKAARLYINQAKEEAKCTLE